VRRVTIAAALTAIAFTGTAEAAHTIRLNGGTTKTIRGDVLWMRTVDSREALAPFTLDHRGRWCWAPQSVFEESCTVTVGKRTNGRRLLENGSRAAVRVTYTRRY